YSLQTVTTVGYGDVVPSAGFGRAVGAVVMLFGIGFTAIVTAWITSTFVEAARRHADLGGGADAFEAVGGLHSRLDELFARLEQIEARIVEQNDGQAGRPPPR
ncbi:MAG: potassium channel family protein, partial [Gaiella sp.]